MDKLQGTAVNKLHMLQSVKNLKPKQLSLSEWVNCVRQNLHLICKVVLREAGEGLRGRGRREEEGAIMEVRMHGVNWKL